MAVNEHALRVIEAARSRHPAIESLYGLIPFRQASAKEVIRQTFEDAMSILSFSMERLVLEAEVNIGNLGNLEDRLGTLRLLVDQEDQTIEKEQNPFSQLLIKLGVDKKTGRKLAVLKNLGTYKRRALAHVKAALHTLETMSEDMEELRQRVTAPELTGSQIQVEVHIKCIRSGLERLLEGRARAIMASQDNRVLDAFPED